MKLKSLALAAALAVAAATPALATVKQVNNGTSELFLVVGDQNGSFLLDTGLTLNQLIAAGPGFSFSALMSAPNYSAAWASYTAADTNLLDGATNSATGTRWALFLYDGSSLPELDSHRVITTLGKGLTAANISFDQGTMSATNSVMGEAGVRANGTGTHTGTPADNGASHNLKGSLPYVGNAFFNFDAAATRIGNKVGDDSALFLITGNAEDGSDPLLPVIGSMTSMTARFDGTTLTISAPIPEPQTYAMLIAGLGALGFVARRRRAN